VFIELVDSLRCLEPHEETWLVAAVDRRDGRHIMHGTLACPICRRAYPIRDGIGWFAREPADAPPHLTIPRGRADGPGDERTDERTDEDRFTRAAALLGLMDAGGIVVLGGPWTEIADRLPALGISHVVVLNAPTTPESPQEVSALVVGDQLPFRQTAVRACALGGGTATDALLASAATVLRSRGRLVGPVSAGVPTGITELARDEADWVGERAAVASPPEPLRSARR
jgi:uncharacterized protein YbaR (Trm112 family)